MKIRIMLVVVVVGMLFSAAISEAKQTKLQIVDKGLLGAMHRMGCHQSWLSAIMHNNGIAEAKLTHLPKDMVLAMPDNCAVAANPEVQKETMEVLSNHSVKSKNASKLANTSPLTKKQPATLSNLSNSKTLSKNLSDTTKGNEQLRATIVEKDNQLTMTSPKNKSAEYVAAVVFLGSFSSITILFFSFGPSKVKDEKKVISAGVAQLQTYTSHMHVPRPSRSGNQT